MRFQVFLSLWSFTSWLYIDMIPEVAKTKVSQTKEILFIKVKTRPRPPKMAHSNTPPHVYIMVWEICKTSPKRTRKERRRNYYSRCSIVAAAGAMSWDAVFHCESESTLFGLPKDDTTRNQWLSCIYNTVPELFNTNIRLCAAHFMEDYFLNLEE